jgi:hypothetical protein
MALMTSLEEGNRDRLTVHQPTRCFYSIVEGEEGRRYVQLNTTGSAERQFAGKSSQAIQFDRVAAAQLIEVFRQVFLDLK